jgi:hypothetical protein
MKIATTHGSQKIPTTHQWYFVNVLILKNKVGGKF